MLIIKNADTKRMSIRIAVYSLNWLQAGGEEYGEQN